MPQRRTKEKLLREFQLMKDFESWTGDFYIQVSSDPKIKEEAVRELFKKISLDEEKHTQIVQRIINIISNNL